MKKVVKPVVKPNSKVAVPKNMQPQMKGGGKMKGKC